MSDTIARTVIEQMAAQTELIMTLAVAVAGGIVALLVKLVLHNSDSGKDPVKLAGTRLLIVALMVEGFSISAAVFARAAITATAPEVFKQDFADISSWSTVVFDGALQTKVAAGTQFLLFLSGLALVCVFVLMNRQVVAGSEPDP